MFSLYFLSVFSLCVFSLCVFSLCFLPVCFLCVFSLCVSCLCVFSLCFLSVFSVFSVCVFSLCFLSVCFLSLCFLSVRSLVVLFCWRLLGLIPGGTPFSQLNKDVRHVMSATTKRDVKHQVCTKTCMWPQVTTSSKHRKEGRVLKGAKKRAPMKFKGKHLCQSGKMQPRKRALVKPEGSTCAGARSAREKSGGAAW